MRLLALLGLASALGCAGDPIPLRDCTPGATLPCACVGGAAGAQVCAADAHLGACVCPDASTPVDALEGDAGPDGAVDVLQVADAADAGADVAAADRQADAPDAPTCPAGFADCDGVASNGCETNITLVTSCRACGVRCDLAAATSRCGAMGCEIVTCDRGFADCDHNAANGCEEYLEAPESCGVCGSRCAARPNTSARCDSMRCSYLCIAGWCDADGMAANGCETRC